MTPIYKDSSLNVHIPTKNIYPDEPSVCQKCGLIFMCSHRGSCQRQGRKSCYCDKHRPNLTYVCGVGTILRERKVKVMLI